MQTDTTTTKTTETQCPKCSSTLQDFSVNFNCKMLMCENVKCPYPFDQPTANSFIVKDNSIPKNEKSDKEKYVRSHESPSGINATTTNTVPDQANIVSETSNYSLQDIEQLLQDDNMTTIRSDFDTSSVQDLEHFFTSDSISPEGSEDGQPEQSCVNTPIDDQSGLFNGLDQILSDNWNKDCDPFSTELDSLLGI
ncbi:hypothetical protein BDC45DRAFT_499311 [Circinella umbellata]|nr:hypothetical protein BDC45DRAFT_499311 [Circinella umbellata]